MSYITKIAPFLTDGDFVRCYRDTLSVDNIFCPVNYGNSKDNKSDIQGDNSKENFSLFKKRIFKVYHILPCDIFVFNEKDTILKEIQSGKYGLSLECDITEIDYMPVAKRIEINDSTASILVNGAYMQEDIVSDVIVNSASNGSKVMRELLDDISIEGKKDVVSMSEFLNKDISESADYLDDLLKASQSQGGISIESGNTSTDFIYDWLDSYFALPEGEDMKSGGREVVPLLIGPTGVFKSATIKELCGKYGYRLVDFRVSFTSRLDYSGLFQMGEVDGKKYSYACPMEELVTCSDGFREYCREAYDKITKILSDGYVLKDKSSDGTGVNGEKEYLSDGQKKELQKLLESYKEYMKTPVLFFDEITRCMDGGVEGVLVQLLNQKKFNNMTMNGCKFVAATNMNLTSNNPRHNDLMYELDNMYDVNTDLDVAYSNRFMPLKVRPEDVQDRWFEWASGTKVDKNNKEVSNIHHTIIDFLSGEGSDMVYNDTPVLDAIENGLNDNELKSQTFPNYRTWDMLSDYMYQVDRNYEFDLQKNEEAKRTFKTDIINGLISKWAGEKFTNFLKNNGYTDIKDILSDEEKDSIDDVGDFLESTLEANVPALLIGPSSLGKTSRVNAYKNKVKERTGIEPILINVNLASMDTVDLMGMPTKTSLVDFVAGGSLESKGLGSVGKELKDIVNSVSKNDSYGMVDTLTQRAPDKGIKDRFKKALDEGREVILFFDECNRVKNPTIMSSMFECISDSRFCGVSFKHQKDKVKIIAACNMSSTEMDEMGEDVDYSNAGSLDPALAARFSVYWKKKYDEKDVRSWINFMNDLKAKGEIDGTLVSYFESLPVEKCINIIASVEKRKIENAESSTRALLQLSKDIKSMRGKADESGFKKSLYNGKVIFDDITVQKFININDKASDISCDIQSLAQELDSFIRDILSQKDMWEPLLVGDKITMNGKEMSGQDLMDTLEALQSKTRDLLLRPLSESDKKTLKIYVSTALSIVDACNRMDFRVSEKRQGIFEYYVGEEFARDFLPYFNSVFGTDADMDITIEMLEDDSLIEPFMNKEKVMNINLSSSDLVDHMIGVMKEFWKVHSNRLPSKNYSMFIDGVTKVFPTTDSVAEMLERVDVSLDDMFCLAEENGGDAWILNLLKSYPGMFTQTDIDSIRDKASNNTKRKSRIL